MRSRRALDFTSRETRMDLAAIELRSIGVAASASECRHPLAGARGYRNQRTCAGASSLSTLSVPLMATVSLLDVQLELRRRAVARSGQSPDWIAASACASSPQRAGKSTLIESHRGELAPDVGQVFRQQGRCFQLCAREVAGLTATVRTVVEGEGGAYEEHNDWERHDPRRALA